MEQLSPTKCAFKELQHTVLEVCSNSEVLDYLVQVGLIRVGAKQCGTVAALVNLLFVLYMHNVCCTTHTITVVHIQ